MRDRRKPRQRRALQVGTLARPGNPSMTGADSAYGRTEDR